MTEEIDRYWSVVEEALKRLNDADIDPATRARRMAVAKDQIALLEKLQPGHPGIAVSREALAALREAGGKEHS